MHAGAAQPTSRTEHRGQAASQAVVRLVVRVARRPRSLCRGEARCGRDGSSGRLAQQALEKLSGQLIEAQEQERSRIARDLHDDICQRLALLSMEIEQANRAAGVDFRLPVRN